MADTYRTHTADCRCSTCNFWRDYYHSADDNAIYDDEGLPPSEATG